MLIVDKGCPYFLLDDEKPFYYCTIRFIFYQQGAISAHNLLLVFSEILNVTIRIRK